MHIHSGKPRLHLTNLQLYLLNLPSLDFSPISPDDLPALTPLMTRENYFSDRQPLILEEIFAQLKQALAATKGKATERVVLDEYSDSFYYYRESDVTQAVLKNWTEDNRIRCEEVAAFRFIVALLTFPGASPQIAIINKNYNDTEVLVRSDCRALFEDSHHIDIRPLTSLISLDRMYQLCSLGRGTPLISRVINADVTAWSGLGVLAAASTSGSALAFGDFAVDSKLNAVQASVVKEFFEADEGLFLLQGPPGTGKTTTIVSLLTNLLNTEESTLVCAPSNKAIQVLARRTAEENLFAPIALVGVESKITSDLQEISISHWLDRYPKAAEMLIINWGNGLDPDYCGQGRSVLTRDFHINEVNLLLMIRALEGEGNKLAKLLQVMLRFYDERTSAKVKLYNQFTKMLADIISECKSLLPIKTLPKLGAATAPKSEPLLSGEALYSRIQILHKKNKEMLSFVAGFIDYYRCFRRDDDLLNLCSVVFSTLSTAGRPRLAHICPAFAALVIDEAGQAVETEALLAFQLANTARRALIVGDTRQLPATTIADSARVTHFDWSLLWRLIEENTAPFTRLNTQYRMRAAIRHFPSGRYYDGALHDHESIAARVPHFGVAEGHHFWIDVLGGREESSGRSYINRVEAQELIQAVKEVRRHDPHASIGVISFYSAQVDLLRRLAKHEGLSGGHFIVNTVDGFQGDECDIIFISFVRASASAGIGFLGDFRRLNVAITRAKHGLYIFGHGATFDRARASEPQELLAFCRKKRSVISSRDFVKALTAAKAVVPEAVVKVQSLGSGSAALARVMLQRREERKIFRPPLTISSEELLRSAHSFEEALKYEHAIEIYQKLLEKDHERPDLYESIANCYDNIGKKADAALNREIAKSMPVISAEQIAERSKKALPVVWQNPPRHVVQIEKEGIKTLKEARRLSDAGRFPDAEHLYRELLEILPENPDVLIGLGWSLNKQKRQREALPYFLKSQEIRPSVLALIGLAHISNYRGNPVEALDYIEQGLDAFPWSRALQEHKDRLMKRGIRLPERISRPGREGVRYFPSLSEVSEEAAVPVGALSLGVLAESGFGNVVAASSALPRSTAASMAARLSTNAADIDDVMEMLSGNVAQPQPITTIVTASLPFASVVASSGASIPAVLSRSSHYSVVPKMTKSVTEQEIQAAIALSKAKQPDKALSKFEALFKRDPEHPGVLNGMGWSCSLLYRHEEAIPYFEKSLTSKKTAQAYLGLATAFSFLRDKSSALRVVNQGLKDFPDYKKLIDLKNKFLTPTSGHAFLRERDRASSASRNIVSRG